MNLSRYIKLGLIVIFTLLLTACSVNYTRYYDDWPDGEWISNDHKIYLDMDTRMGFVIQNHDKKEIVFFKTDEWHGCILKFVSEELIYFDEQNFILGTYSQTGDQLCFNDRISQKTIVLQKMTEKEGVVKVSKEMPQGRWRCDSPNLMIDFDSRKGLLIKDNKETKLSIVKESYLHTYSLYFDEDGEYPYFHGTIALKNKQVILTSWDGSQYFVMNLS